ncbi:hypothetical protein B0J14DRAFT_649568 [Halenospora varia]|nr:hypothetical protein B0J14DRAFT_649568 [Halenospora varia]
MATPISIPPSGVSRPDSEWRLTPPLTPEEIKRTEAHFMPYDAGDELLPYKLAYAKECEEGAVKAKAEALTTGQPPRPLSTLIQPNPGKVCSRRKKVEDDGEEEELAMRQSLRSSARPIQPKPLKACSRCKEEKKMGDQKSTVARKPSSSVPIPAFASPEIEVVREKVPVVEEPVTATQVPKAERKSSRGRLLSNLFRLPLRKFTKSKEGEKSAAAQTPIYLENKPASAPMLPPELAPTPAISSTPAPACSPLPESKDDETEAFPAFDEDLSMEGLSTEPSYYVDVYHPEWRATVKEAAGRVESAYKWVGQSRIEIEKMEKKMEREPAEKEKGRRKTREG